MLKLLFCYQLWEYVSPQPPPLPLKPRPPPLEPPKVVSSNWEIVD